MEIINIVIACVASVSARVRREKLGREQEKRKAPFFFAPALTFAQYLEWKRLLRRLIL